MAKQLQPHGAKALVHIKYEGDLKKLAVEIEGSLNIPSFWYKTDMDYPYQETAMSECMGFELWLNESKVIKGYPFVIEVQSTAINGNLEFHSTKHDISKWFSNYLSFSCDFETCIAVA